MHALTRFRERYGREMSYDRLQELQGAIARGETGRYLHPDNTGREIWEVEVDGVTALAVYNPADGRVVTFLHPPRLATLGDVWPAP